MEIHDAVKRGNREMLEYLLSSDGLGGPVDVTHKDENGCTHCELAATWFAAPHCALCWTAEQTECEALSRPHAAALICRWGTPDMCIVWSTEQTSMQRRNTA